MNGADNQTNNDKNADETWLAMLIFRATDIPGLHKSPGEILNGRKYRTGLPMIDIHQKATEREIEKLLEKRSKLASKAKELPRLPVGTEILYQFNPDSDKTKHSKWCRYHKNRFNPRKYDILKDNDRVITQSTKQVKCYKTTKQGVAGLAKAKTDLGSNRSFKTFKTTVYIHNL